MMKKSVGWVIAALFLALFFFVRGAHASVVPLTWPDAVMSTAAGSVATKTATVAGGAVTANLTTQVSSKLITVPASWRLASNAPRVAAAALRLNPIGLGTSILLSWAAQYGIQWINDQWQTAVVGAPGDAPGTGYYYNGTVATMAPSPAEACQKLGDLWWANATAYWPNWGMSTAVDAAYRCTVTLTAKVGGTKQYPYSNTAVVRMANQYPAQWTPADQAVWDAKAWNLTDAVAQDILKGDVKLPLDSPMVDTRRQVVPLSSPYKDPVTGKTMEDVAYITPSPDGQTADVQVAKQEVDPATGQPVTDASGAPVAPQKQEDPCVGHETRVGCMEKGEIADSPMPEVPKLYEQKYPEGIAGVWEANKPDVKSTAFYQGVASMFPSFGAGQCPVWHMSFNLGAAGNFGVGDLTVPCWIFQALGLVMLATATFTARKILF